VNKGDTGEKRWRKAELHTHCNLDPLDYKVCNYSPERLITEAAGLGYEILAITCHNRDVWNADLAEFAAGHGITLVPGMEVSVERRYHILAYNFHAGSEHLATFAKIRARRREDTLVVAPHPYFPSWTCLGRRLEENIDVFDAIETSGYYVPWIDFNRRALAVGRKHSKPMVGNGDVHLLWQLGRTFTWIYAEPSVGSILEAVRKGNVRVETHAITYADAIRFWASAITGLRPRRQDKVGADDLRLTIND
jgi:predicted metal-dependent phosphoesterase TrpH